MVAAQFDQAALEDSGLFDAEWYRCRYPDVDMLGMDPMRHFLWLGSRLGRSPGPRFDAEFYRQTHPDIAGSWEPVLHYIHHGRAEGRRVARVSDARLSPQEETRRGIEKIEGGATPRAGRPTILLCSHVAGRALFGGERSFVDMIDALNTLDMNVIVTAPSDGNPGYLETLRQKSLAVYVFRYNWWREGVPVDDRIVTDFARIICDEGVDTVHTNTIVLREPLLAARRMGVRSVMHVRELIHHDDALLKLIGEPAEDIVDWIWKNCDHVIANSSATLHDFAKGGYTPSLVYNTADFEHLSQIDPPGLEGAMRVGLISSNLPKKGIHDFAEIARALAVTHPDVRFHLIGPETDHTAVLMDKVASGDLPPSLKVLGYRDTPAEAVAEADVILNLSHFQESFGRTVLEGMAAGRPSIVYRYGAPPEFVDEGKTGYVVRLGDTEAVASHLRRLADDRALLQQMGRQAREEATRRFAPGVYAEQMRAAYDTLEARAAPPKKLTLRARADMAPLPRAALKIAYFCWHFPVPSETFVLNELRLLVAQGHDVRVYCKQSPHPDFEPDFDITWERVTDAAHLADRLTATGRTMVHAHFVYPTVTDMVWPACEAAGVPFTFIAHAQDIFRYANDAKNRIDEIGQSPLCAKVFVPSRFNRDYLAERGVPEEKLMINANGCDVRLYGDGWTEGRTRRPFRRIVAVHRFTEKKGLVHLIRAAKLLERENLRIELYGYGELEAEYRRIIAEEDISNVRLCGPIKGRAEMLELFRGSDLFACPSVRAQDGDMDGIPTVLMEAMAAGLPVLTTALSGIPDLVEDNVTGYVCDATPQAIAARIRAYYALPNAAVAAVIDNAFQRIKQDYNTEHLVENLLRVWADERIDLLIVSWNNLAELTEVTRRLFTYTSMPFHLIICDNGSAPETLIFLLDLQAKHDNVTLILNRDNTLVGPGTNICLENGQSDYAIYVCGKEGMTTRHGWEKPFVTYMNAHADVGLAGTLCHSPSYLFGRDYPTAQPLFAKFRNREFALDHPDRVFSHVQGGFFILRRAMYDDIGGFCETVPHNSTDVEFSHYVESCGWKLGQVPGMLALYNKTRPGLFHRIDETMGALHPPTLDDLDAVDAIATAAVHHCNACGKSCARFEDLDGPARCPHCRATRRTRSLHRVLAESVLLYRRLPALGVNVPAALAEFWEQQFQGQMLNSVALAEELRSKGRLNIDDNRLDLVMLNDALGQDAAASDMLIHEAARLLKPGGTLILAGGPDLERACDAFATMGLTRDGTRRYASKVSHYDWRDIHILKFAPR